MTTDIALIMIGFLSIFVAILVGGWAARVAVKMEREHAKRAESYWASARAAYPPPPEPPKGFYDTVDVKEFRSTPDMWSSVIKEPIGLLTDKDGDYECPSCKMKLTVVTKKTSHDSEDGLD